MSRVLAVLDADMSEYAPATFFVRELGSRYPLRICYIKKGDRGQEKVLEFTGWSTGIARRVLEGISQAYLIGMSTEILNALENGDLEENCVKLITLCFTEHVPVYLWEEYLWENDALLPEPVKKQQKRIRMICDWYKIIRISGNMVPAVSRSESVRRSDFDQKSDSSRKHVFTMEDIGNCRDRIKVGRNDFFTPLAQDYIRENHICVDYM